MDLVRSLVHKRIKLGERHQIYTQGETCDEHTSVGSETSILQSHPCETRLNSEGVIHGPHGERLPSSSGDLLRSPGWSFSVSLISRMVPEIGAYCITGLTITQNELNIVRLEEEREEKESGQ